MTRSRVIHSLVDLLDDEPLTAKLNVVSIEDVRAEIRAQHKARLHLLAHEGLVFADWSGPFRMEG